MMQYQSAESPSSGGSIARRGITSLTSGEARPIAQHFSRYLKPELANTEALKRAVYRLRHRVYCEELQFEEQTPSHEEKDAFDDVAEHCFIRHLSTGRMAGTVRVVSAAADGRLPIEHYGAEAIADVTHAPQRFDRHTVCEISRLAVPAEFRKRAIDHYRGAATGAINLQTYSVIELRCFPYIAVALYLAAGLLAIRAGKHNAYALMEPRLARGLAYVGIPFIPLGEPILFHGRKRTAYYINADMFRHNLSPGYQRLLRSIERDLFGHEQPDHTASPEPLPES